MISADFCRLIVHYNTCQNGALINAADGRTDHARRLNRDAFSGSITDPITGARSMLC